MLAKYSTQDLLLISAFSAIGLAVKPIITPLIHLLSAPLLIPGGALAGGFYMLWLGMVVTLVRKPGAAFLTGLTQGIVIFALGFFGSHGIVSILTYSFPGLVVDLLALVIKRRFNPCAQALFCAAANLTGTAIVSLVLMRLSSIPLLLSLVASVLSGIVGGILAYILLEKILLHQLIANPEEE